MRKFNVPLTEQTVEKIFQCHSDLLSCIEEAGGSIKWFLWPELETMSAKDLICTLALNKITFVRKEQADERGDENEI